MIKKDGQWRIEKDVLDWEFEGKEKTMVLEAEKIQFILGILKDWCRAKTGILFATFHKICCKVQHASKGIPAVKALFTPINQILGIRPEPPLVWVRPGSKLRTAIKGSPRIVAPILPDLAVVAVIGWLLKEKGCLWGVVDSIAWTGRWCRRNEWQD